MFFSNNDGYMQDLYFYNQQPNTYMPNNMQNIDMMQGMYNSNPNYYNNNCNVTNYNSLYPSIYKIILPVAQKVITNNNYKYLNEDSLNNMTDTVFNIVDGQINYTNENSGSTNMETNTQVATNTVNSSSNRNTDSNRTNLNNPNSISNNSDNCDYLLKDIIKIIILDELMKQRNFRLRNQCSCFQCQSPANYNMNF